MCCVLQELRGLGMTAEPDTCLPSFGAHVKSISVLLMCCILQELRGLGMTATNEEPEWKVAALGKAPTFGIKDSRSILEQRQSLPIYALKDPLVQAVKDNQVRPGGAACWCLFIIIIIKLVSVVAFFYWWMPAVQVNSGQMHQSSQHACFHVQAWDVRNSCKHNGAVLPLPSAPEGGGADGVDAMA
jgi:hypothetical protein